MLFRNTLLALATMGIVALVAGCGRGNGLPGDLAEHLSRHGISVEILGFEAPLSSRAGFLFFEEETSIEQKIIAEFDLRKVEPGSREFESISSRVIARPEALWGVTDRPAKLKLRGGLQLEYLYLLQTGDGRTYLLAEYAYG
jgi:hypothetical protein